MRKRKGRPVNGILLLDKATGCTSNFALQQVKRLFEANKAGHTGSLDPLATGMLPVCFGEATKISNFLLNADKRYVARCRLGVRTDSADSDGKIIRRVSQFSVSRTEVLQILQRFTGEIDQIPPMHSAIKKDGVPLYRLAHKGQEIDREPRQVRISSLELLELTQDSIEIDVTCSKGTYIRTLADDIGEALGCGAHIVALRRLQVGPFTSRPMYRLDDLNSMKEQGLSVLDACLLPIEEALADWPSVSLSAEAAHFLRQGQPVFVPQIKCSGNVRLFLPSNQFLGIGTVTEDGRIAPKRLMNMTNIG